MACTALIFQPILFLRFTAQLTPMNDYHAYVTDWTAGWAATSAVDYLLQTYGKTDALVLVAIRPDAGNPESTVIFSLRQQPFVMSYLPDVPLAKHGDCFQFAYPTYFVTRDRQLGGIDGWWEEQQRFSNPDGGATVGVYQGKAGCVVAVAN